MADQKESFFKKIANRKGWTLVQIGERWGLSERQMSRVSNSAKQKDVDAVNGLPVRLTKKNKEIASFLGLSTQQLKKLALEFYKDSSISVEKPCRYYFCVPKDTPLKILEQTGWKAGQLINNIPPHLFFIESEK